MTIALCNFITFLDASDTARYRFQDFFINETKIFGGVDYLFAPFNLSPGAGTSGGDRSSESIVFALNELSSNIATEAMEGGWHLEVEMVRADPVSLNLIGSPIVSDRWRINSYEEDTEVIAISLSSPFDAVSLVFPKERISRDKFGILPITGNIQLTS